MFYKRWGTSWSTERLLTPKRNFVACSQIQYHWLSFPCQRTWFVVYGCRVITHVKNRIKVYWLLGNRKWKKYWRRHWIPYIAMFFCCGMKRTARKTWDIRQKLYETTNSCLQKVNSKNHENLKVWKYWPRSTNRRFFSPLFKCLENSTFYGNNGKTYSSACNLPWRHRRE